ncbi:MAG TPA: hypothetical protein ENJ29_08280 [Bacteroidetes bacterium]|nr:hypothetical protein [Bacteroidota bacterium]
MISGYPLNSALFTAGKIRKATIQKKSAGGFSVRQCGIGEALLAKRSVIQIFYNTTPREQIAPKLPPDDAG